MATIVIRKEMDDLSYRPISTTDIEALFDENNMLLSVTQAIKQNIEIVYDNIGHTNIRNLDLGIQYDHRVTWLEFNLDQLIWNTYTRQGYTELTKYNFYVFKLIFTNLQDNSSRVYEFDGKVFEVPRTITKNAGKYDMTLVIEENLDPETTEGNIPDRFPIERFVAKPVKCTVKASNYNPDVYEIDVNMINTYQKAALTKHPIMATLTDNGTLTTDRKELGQKYDSYSTYIKFNAKNITAHLNDFMIIGLFEQDENYYTSLCEVATDGFDDNTDSNPLNMWIPTEVYEQPGNWNLTILAFAGKLDDLHSEDNVNYYFYVSSTLKMKVEDSKVKPEDLSVTPTDATFSNIVTSEGDSIIDKDGYLYQLGGTTEND